MDLITGKTGLTGLLGRPVAHSISPMMHNTSFQDAGLNYVYLCFDVGEEELEEAVTGLKRLGARGWNCTMPDKTRMADLCDKLSLAASLTRAVNTVVNENGVLTGYNTDGIGYMRSIRVKGYDLTGKRMTLLGTGPAARSILAQAAIDGLREITVFNRRGRSFEEAAAMIERVNAETSCRVYLYDYEDRERFCREIAKSDILTNATSVGMAPDTDQCLIDDIGMLHRGLIVSDIIYNPRETKLLSMARSAGCPAINGLYMLLYQGAEAFLLWTGKEMPVEKIRRLYFSEQA